MSQISVESFFDPVTSTLSYLVWEPQSLDAVVIDPVLNFDWTDFRFSHESVDALEGFIKENSLHLRWIMETHVHADHISGGAELKKRFPQSQTVIGKNILQVQKTFAGIFGESEFPCDGSQFDRLVSDGESLELGRLSMEILETPGHTPACCSFLIADCVFTGDAMFMPDFGVARCDFPGGDATTLYHSVKNKLYSLPGTTRTLTGHDYQPGGRELRFESTIDEQKKSNIHISGETTQGDFVEFRTTRDSGLREPKLLWPSLYVNMRAGQIPEDFFLKIPLRQK